TDKDRLMTFCQKAIRRSLSVSKFVQTSGVCRSLLKRRRNHACPVPIARKPITKAAAFGENFGCVCAKAGAHLILVTSTHEKTARQGIRTATSVTSKMAFEYAVASELFGLFRASAYLRKKYRAVQPTSLPPSCLWLQFIGSV